MDLATLIGIVAGFAIIVAAIFTGGDINAFIDVPSILIVIGGGIAATLIRFPLTGILGAFTLGAKIAFTHKKTSNAQLIEKFAEMAEVVRKNGPLGLENVDINDDMMRKGAQFVADGYDAEFIKENMELELNLGLERLEEGQRVFKALGDAGPAFGMIGTLVGLVQMLATMDDPSTIGPAMAIALLTTLYGAVLSNLICLPMADKMESKFKVDALKQTLIIDGILQLRANKSPAVMKEMLVAYLPEKQRLPFMDVAAA
ncbi:MAG: MotA/TolQ/ExbB proton channel family protein [Rhizobiales bacterium]|nr:MotA/TolQ/ExbB proton channel family protein [Hyphomicrobiales bacterium]